MTYNTQLIKELESLLNGSIDPTMFPYAKGNSIRIGDYVVRSNKRGFYKIYNLESNKLITETFCKSSAVALAKTLARSASGANDIIQADKEIMKHYNDCIFYKHTIRVSKDKTRRHVAQIRYDIAKQKTLHAKSHLDRYIYT